MIPPVVRVQRGAYADEALGVLSPPPFSVPTTGETVWVHIPVPGADDSPVYPQKPDAASGLVDTARTSHS